MMGSTYERHWGGDDLSRRSAELSDTPHHHMRRILSGLPPGSVVTPPPDKIWDQMSNYERGWSLAYDEQNLQQERQRHALHQIQTFRREHPVRYHRAVAGLRLRVFIARLIVFAFVALFVVLVDLVLIWLHSPIILRPRW